MRHPAAPTVIAILLGFLVFMLVWAKWRSDGHHEGNPQIVEAGAYNDPDKEKSLADSSDVGIEG